MRPLVVREATGRAQPGGLQERAQQVGAEVGQGAAPRRAAPQIALPYGNEIEFILFVGQKRSNLQHDSVWQMVDRFCCRVQGQARGVVERLSDLIKPLETQKPNSRGTRKCAVWHTEHRNWRGVRSGYGGVQTSVQ